MRLSSHQRQPPVAAAVVDHLDRVATAMQRVAGDHLALEREKPEVLKGASSSAPLSAALLASVRRSRAAWTEIALAAGAAQCLAVDGDHVAPAQQRRAGADRPRRGEPRGHANTGRRFSGDEEPEKLQAHNLKVVGSNPTPATRFAKQNKRLV
jgi:hypothetical protein